MSGRRSRSLDRDGNRRRYERRTRWDDNREVNTSRDKERAPSPKGATSMETVRDGDRGRRSSRSRSGGRYRRRSRSRDRGGTSTRWASGRDGDRGRDKDRRDKHNGTGTGDNDKRGERISTRWSKGKDSSNSNTWTSSGAMKSIRGDLKEPVQINSNDNNNSKNNPGSESAKPGTPNERMDEDMDMDIEMESDGKDENVNRNEDASSTLAEISPRPFNRDERQRDERGRASAEKSPRRLNRYERERSFCDRDEIVPADVKRTEYFEKASKEEKEYILALRDDFLLELKQAEIMLKVAEVNFDLEL
mmetsp:Transcript_34908/g.43126  ORF Transcript_34908/g.43126 Transcript_34908/m.43126 type:complete len:305 (-) Transcript_34908:1963-2877(-)